MTVFVPESVPPPGLVNKETVIELVALETSALLLSSTCTATAIAAPAVELAGCVENDSLVPGPAMTTPPMTKLELVAGVSIATGGALAEKV